MAFGQEPEKEEYCMKCIYAGKHRLTYVMGEKIIQKVIKPKKINGRCERCMKY